MTIKIPNDAVFSWKFNLTCLWIIYHHAASSVDFSRVTAHVVRESSRMAHGSQEEYREV